MESTQVLSDDEGVLEARTQVLYYIEIRSPTHGTRFEDITRGCNTIGREKEDVVIHLDSPTVSRIHAQIILQEDGLLTLEDLGSANKTWKNACKLQPHIRYSLEGNEVLKFGDVQVFLFPGSCPPQTVAANQSPLLIPETPFAPKTRRSIIFDEDKLFVPASQSSPLCHVNETHDEDDEDDDISFVPATQKAQEDAVASLLNEETQKLNYSKDVILSSDDETSSFELSKSKMSKSETQNESGLFLLPTQKLDLSKREISVLKGSNKNSELIKLKFSKNASNMDELLLNGIFSQDLKSSHANEGPVEQVDNVSDEEPILLSTQELLNDDEGVSVWSQESNITSQNTKETDSRENSPIFNRSLSPYFSQKKTIVPVSSCSDSKSIKSGTEIVKPAKTDTRDKPRLSLTSSVESEELVYSNSVDLNAKDYPVQNEVNYQFQFSISFATHHLLHLQSHKSISSDVLPHELNESNISYGKSSKVSPTDNVIHSDLLKEISNKCSNFGEKWPHFLSISLLSHVVLNFYASKSSDQSDTPRGSNVTTLKKCPPKRNPRRSSKNNSLPNVNEHEVPTRLKAKPTVISLTVPPRLRQPASEVSMNTTSVLSKSSSKKRFSLDCEEEETEKSKIPPKNSKRRKTVVEAVPSRRRSTRLQKVEPSMSVLSSPKENSKRKSTAQPKDEPKSKSSRRSTTKVKVEPLTENMSVRNKSIIDEEDVNEELNVKSEPLERRGRKSKVTPKNSQKRNSQVAIKVKVEPVTEKSSKRRTVQSSKEMDQSLYGSDSSLDETKRSFGRRRFKPVIMFTGYDDTKNDSKVVKELGGLVTENVKDCNLAVMNKLRRTVKLVAVVGKGVPIVDRNYLALSKEAKYFLDPWKYLIQDHEFQKSYSCILRSTLRHSEKKGILSDLEVHITKSVEPPPSQFQCIVECAGGRFLKDLRKKKTEGVIVISCPKDFNIYQKHIEAGRIVVSKEFLLTGILKHELDFKTFSLK